jgi:hypothetical protein
MAATAVLLMSCAGCASVPPVQYQCPAQPEPPAALMRPAEELDYLTRLKRILGSPH